VVDDPEAVTTFCAEHSIFRKMFYAIRQRAREDGPAAALGPRPAPSPETITDVAVDNHQPRHLDDHDRRATPPRIAQGC
jgi:hypothetical protein